MSLDNQIDIRTIKEAKKILTDLAFDEKRIIYPTEFEAIRKGVQALSIAENNPNAISVDEFRIVQNVVNYTKGLKNTENWCKVQRILLAGSKHSGRTRSIEKAFELGVDPYSVVWEKVGAK